MFYAVRCVLKFEMLSYQEVKLRLRTRVQRVICKYWLYKKNSIPAWKLYNSTSKDSRRTVHSNNTFVSNRWLKHIAEGNVALILVNFTLNDHSTLYIPTKHILQSWSCKAHINAKNDLPSRQLYIYTTEQRFGLSFGNESFVFRYSNTQSKHRYATNHLSVIQKCSAFVRPILVFYIFMTYISHFA